MKVRGWKAQFKRPGGDLQVFRSLGNTKAELEAAWAVLPADGVQTIMIYYVEEYAPGKPYRDFMGGHDYYYVRGDPTDQDSYVQSDTFDVGDPSLKRGTLIPQKQYEDLVKTTMDDMDVSVF